MQGNIVTSVEIECFIAQNHSLQYAWERICRQEAAIFLTHGKRLNPCVVPFASIGSALCNGLVTQLTVPTACAVLGHQEAVGLGEEEPKDGEAVGQQPEHLPGVLGHPVDIQLVRRPLVMVCTLHPTRANALCGSHWREGLAIQMFSCSSRLVKLAPNQGVL